MIDEKFITKKIRRGQEQACHINGVNQGANLSMEETGMDALYEESDY